MARKKHHQEHHEEHIDETWLIPYSDLLTLLLALFIVLFASAQLDQKKFEQIASAFNTAFNTGAPWIMDSYKTPPTVNRTDLPRPPQLDKNPLAGAGFTIEQAAVQETQQLLEVKRMLDKYISNNDLTGELETQLTNDGLMIRIKDTALFPSGSAQLIPESRRFAVEIAKMLAPLSQKVSISGHTDNVPINTIEFPSNWELSSRRAVNFMRFLLAQQNMDPKRFSATGYGEHQPIMSNDTVEGRAKNRRVEVLILRNFRI